MRDPRLASSMEIWLDDVRRHFIEAMPALAALFDIYADEARFGRNFIDMDLQRLPAGARVLEIGAGSLLLSCQLQREGFQVTALEPVGSGFSHFDRMRELVMERARGLDCCPCLLALAAEDLSETEAFDYAFSVNVMEHVDAVPTVVDKVGRSLMIGATYRFTCPNYLFPYEPHFNLPTLFSKGLTEKVLGRRILGSARVPDPAGTWRSLNWINVVQMRRITRRLPWLRVEFNRSLLVSTLERITVDSRFADRRSSVVRTLLSWIVRSRLHRLFRFVPATCQPIMDCRMHKISVSGA